MQLQIASLQTRIEAKEFDITSGGGAVQVKINGVGKFLGLTIDPEFLKEDAALVSETILNAVQDAARQAKEYNDTEMQKVTSAFSMPGLF